MGQDCSNVFVNLWTGTLGQGNWRLQLQIQGHTQDLDWSPQSHLPEDEVRCSKVIEVQSFLLLNLLLENADIVRLENIDTESFSWTIFEKQAVEEACRHQSCMQELFGFVMQDVKMSKVPLVTSILNLSVFMQVLTLVRAHLQLPRYSPLTDATVLHLGKELWICCQVLWLFLLSLRSEHTLS